MRCPQHPPHRPPHGLARAPRRGLSSALPPQDFRWFIGRHSSLECDEREWVAAACARPVALKQCLGLPKPLWHEVMELCGDWCAELSQIEIQKRTDLED